MPYSQISYVEAAASMDEKAWLSCHVNMFRFFGGTPVKVVCDNLKTGVTSHPKRGEIIRNEAYLSLGGLLFCCHHANRRQKAEAKSKCGRECG